MGYESVELHLLTSNSFPNLFPSLLKSCPDNLGLFEPYASFLQTTTNPPLLKVAILGYR